tara:strand:+ start:2734 stop:2904 length:171 start_codon:yes stop_codon:yes gene_type:complete
MKNLKTFEAFSIIENKDEKSEISKEDEEKYLSVKQRKLPEGLKKGIIKSKKKEEKK